MTRYRLSQNTCPRCGRPTEIKRRAGRDVAERCPVCSWSIESDGQGALDLGREPEPGPELEPFDFEKEMFKATLEMLGGAAGRRKGRR